MPNIKKDENTGKYYFQISLGFDDKSKKRNRVTRRGFDTKGQARKVRDELIKQHNDRKLGLITDVTLESFYEDYMAIAKNNLKESSYNSREIAMKNSILKRFSTYNLNDITPLEVHRWMQDQLENNYAPSTINQHLSFFKDLMNKAVDLELIPNNRLLRVKSLKVEHKEMDIWTIQELNQFLDTFNLDNSKEYMLYTLFKLLFYSGLRINEALALQSKDINNNLVNVDKIIYMKSNEDWKLTSPKSRYSIREVALDQDTLNVVESWKSQAPFDEFLFSTNGQPMSRQTVGYYLKKHAAQAGVKLIRVHDLRHSHASLLIELGVNILAIAKRLGHKDATQVIETYGHLYPDFQLDIISKIEHIKLAP